MSKKSVTYVPGSFGLLSSYPNTGSLGSFSTQSPESASLSLSFLSVCRIAHLRVRFTVESLESASLEVSRQALSAARELAARIAAHPQECLRNDRASVFGQHGLPVRAALAQEFALGQQTVASGETVRGAARFAAGAGRHGAFESP